MTQTLGTSIDAYNRERGTNWEGIYLTSDNRPEIIYSVILIFIPYLFFTSRKLQSQSLYFVQSSETVSAALTFVWILRALHLRYCQLHGT